ncbi:MAG: hypothetical protein ACK4Q5_10930 [Saprospiraceae bacterium]
MLFSKTELKTGFAASEDFFKTVGSLAPSPQVLHLATHGFFFPDPNTGNAGRGTTSLFSKSRNTR